MVLYLVGVGLMLLGMIIIGPKVYKIIKCKKTVKGKWANIQVANGDDDRAVKATFIYSVTGEEYKNNTGWTNNVVFKTGGDILVKYDEKKPQRSYIPGIGMVIKIAVGCMFFVAGVLTVLLEAWIMI